MDFTEKQAWLKRFASAFDFAINKESDTWACLLTGLNHERVVIRIRDGRALISGGTPNDGGLVRRCVMPSITVSVTRPWPVTKKDIRRRFIEPYRRDLAEFMTQWEAAKEQQREREMWHKVFSMYASHVCPWTNEYRDHERGFRIDLSRGEVAFQMNNEQILETLRRLGFQTREEYERGKQKES